MFNRSRLCQNPDCRKPFDPIHPAADCCCKSCNNRLNYLRRKGRKFGIKNPIELRNYCVIHSLLDQRDINKFGEELEKLGVNFSVFPPAVPMVSGDVPSVLRVGNLGLLFIPQRCSIELNIIGEEAHFPIKIELMFANSSNTENNRLVVLFEITKKLTEIQLKATGVFVNDNNHLFLGLRSDKKITIELSVIN